MRVLLVMIAMSPGGRVQLTKCDKVLLTFTVLGALIAESAPPAQWCLVMGMFNGCVYLGLMAGSTDLGVFIGKIGYPAGFAAGASVALLTLGCFLSMMRSRGSRCR